MCNCVWQISFRTNFIMTSLTVWNGNGVVGCMILYRIWVCWMEWMCMVYRYRLYFHLIMLWYCTILVPKLFQSQKGKLICTEYTGGERRVVNFTSVCVTLHESSESLVVLLYSCDYFSLANKNIEWNFLYTASSAERSRMFTGLRRNNQVAAAYIKRVTLEWEEGLARNDVGSALRNARI